MKCKTLKLIIAFILMVSFLIILYARADAGGTIIRVAFDPNLPPYQFIENGEIVGLHIDLLNKIAKKSNFTIEYIPMENTTECLDAINQGQVDIVLGAVVNERPLYRDRYTEIISQSSIGMFVHNSKVADIQNKKRSITATYEEGTISFSFMHYIRDLKGIPVSNQVRAFNLLISGRADALMGQKSSVLYQLKEMNLEDEYTIVNNFMVPVEYAMIVKAGDLDMLKTINTRMHQLRISGEYERIYEKWIREDQYNVKKVVSRLIYIIGIIILISLIILIFNMYLNFMLRKQIEKKTQELQNTNRNLEQQVIETRNSNEIRNRVVENSPSAIVVFNLNYKITLFNESASRFTGKKVIETGMSISDIKLFNTILQGKKESIFSKDFEFQNMEIIYKNEEGQDISYRYNIYLLFNSDNKIRGAILNIEDITKEKRAKEQVFEKEKNKALNQLIAGVAHEIRNPLMSIKTYAELIPIKRDNIHFQNQMAEYVPKEVERINNLIKDLIDYAKPKSNNKENILISSVVDSCLALIYPIIKDRNINIETNLKAGMSIFADQNQLKQTLINILLNGVEAIEEKIENSCENLKSLSLSIEAWEQDQYKYIRVKDEGVGMTEEVIKNVTEPFFTTKAVGTGLGMGICKNFVAENGGKIFIYSKKNEYTEITLKFKVATEKG